MKKRYWILLGLVVWFGMMAALGWLLRTDKTVRVTVDSQISFVRDDWSLVNAIRDGESMEVIEQIARSKPYLLQHRMGGRLPIHDAASSRRPDVIIFLLKNGADVNSRIEGDWGGKNTTPIGIAVGNNDVECVKVLMDAGANPSIPGTWDRTPLQFAEEQGYDEIIRLLKQGNRKSR